MRDHDVYAAATAVQFRPRRACCRGCGRTHVLLAGVALLRRADAVAVIGEAVMANAAGQGHRPIAARIGRPRRWSRRTAVVQVSDA